MQASSQFLRSSGEQHDKLEYYHSPISSKGCNGNRQHVSETTPLLPGPSSLSCKPFPLGALATEVSEQQVQRKADPLDHPNQQFLPPDASNLYRSSSKIGHSRRRRSSSCHVQRPSARSLSSSTFLDDSEICEVSSETYIASSPQQTSLFALPQCISLRLENSGSVARDHLASERTFLAYMRTSLAIASSGVALVQLFSAASASAPQVSTQRLHLYIRPLGASTVVVGLLVLVIGVVRYFTVQAALTRGYFPVARLATGFIALVLTALVTLTFSVMIAGKLEAKKLY